MVARDRVVGRPADSERTPCGVRSIHPAIRIGNRLAAWTGQITLNDVTFSGRETLVELIDGGRGALLVTAHVGSFEVCRALAQSRKNIRLNVLVHTAHAEEFNRVMQSVSPNQHVTLIEVTDLDRPQRFGSNKLAAGELIVIW